MLFLYNNVIIQNKDMATNVKYLSYEGLEYFWNQKLKPIIEENEQLIAVALNDLNNKLTDLATVATSGSYNDLSNTPISMTRDDIDEIFEKEQ